MSLLLPIATFIISSLFGTCLILLLPVFREKTLVIAVGTVIGLTLTTVITYLSSAFFLLTPYLVVTVLTAEAVYIVIANTKYQLWMSFKKLPTNKAAAVILVVLLFFSVLITPKLLFSNPTVDRGVSTGTINAYGDLGFHLSNITNLAYNSTIPPANPILAGNQLTYPFFSNFFSAILLVAGANYSQSVVWPAFLLIPLTLFLFYHLTLNLTNHPKVALIALLLFALGGSTFGWIRVVGDLNMPHESLLQLLANLPINYTGHSDDPLGFFMINPIISLLLPQRSFMFGMSLAFIVLLLLKHHTNHPLDRHALLLAGILAGLLPLWHAHTVIALVPVIIIFFLLYPGRRWLTFLITTALVGLPGVLYFLTSPASASASPHLQLGWMAHDQNIIIFWLKNTGLLLPITLLGFFLPAPRSLGEVGPAPRSLGEVGPAPRLALRRFMRRRVDLHEATTTPTLIKPLACAGLLLFLAANVWLFAAWEWDNTKIFVYWILFTLPLAAYTIVTLWQKNKYYWRSAIIATLIFHLLSGGIDVFRLALPNTPSWTEWDKDAVTMAQFIRTHTKRNDNILIAPYHNSPAALSGRSVYLGFPGHVWTHGGNHVQREQSIGPFYTGQLDTLPQIQPEYVVVGPVERAFFPTLYIRPDWRLVFQQGSYSLYRLP